MAGELHPLLARQLRRLGLSSGDAPSLSQEAASELFDHVSRAYADADRDRYLLERSQSMVVHEMEGLNAHLKASKARLASLLSLSTDWVWEQDGDLRFTYVSSHAGSASHLAAMLDRKQLLHDLVPVSPADAQTWESALHAREPFRNITCEVAVPAGQRLFVCISGEPVFSDGAFVGYRGVGADVTQAVLSDLRVHELASYDSLTGLVNRAMFMGRLEDALARARLHQRHLALLFIDLDRFKLVNDSLGHGAGDELLKVMSDRLKTLLRDADVVARLGGDEFVVLIDDCADPAVLSKVASRVLTTLGEPLHLLGRSVHVSASVGIGVFPADGSDSSTLLKSADTAMYLAKSKGKNNFQFFTPQLAERAARHFALEGELREALARDDLRVHYQPKFDVRTGLLVGMEALVRWQHPTRGLLGPGEFIELAEESGLIVPLGRWVLRQACAQIRNWREEGFGPPMVSVNLSARQFTAGIVGDVREALGMAMLESNALEVEITESLLMSDPDEAQRILNELKALGVRAAIDDFGTGYSSLAYLKRFAAQTLKIDRSFVQGLPSDCGDAAITHAVVTLAHRMNMQVVAEGVETAEQLNYLRELGCDQAQGYLLGRPVPADTFRDWLEFAPDQTDPCVALDVHSRQAGEPVM